MVFTTCITSWWNIYIFLAFMCFGSSILCLLFDQHFCNWWQHDEINESKVHKRSKSTFVQILQQSFILSFYNGKEADPCLHYQSTANLQGQPPSSCLSPHSWWNDPQRWLRDLSFSDFLSEKVTNVHCPPESAYMDPGVVTANGHVLLKNCVSLADLLTSVGFTLIQSSFDIVW